MTVANRMQFFVFIQAALGPTYQAATPPFLTPRLDAGRWALR